MALDVVYVEKKNVQNRVLRKYPFRRRMML